VKIVFVGTPEQIKRDILDYAKSLTANEAQPTVVVSDESAEVSPEGFPVCPYCNLSFPSKRSRGAHMKYCQKNKNRIDSPFSALYKERQDNK
jgi:hypothetical protein